MHGVTVAISCLLRLALAVHGIHCGTHDVRIVEAALKAEGTGKNEGAIRLLTYNGASWCQRLIITMQCQRLIMWGASVTRSANTGKHGTTVAQATMLSVTMNTTGTNATAAGESDCPRCGQLTRPGRC